MSTTPELRVAQSYAESRVPLLLKYNTRAAQLPSSPSSPRRTSTSTLPSPPSCGTFIMILVWKAPPRSSPSILRSLEPDEDARGGRMRVYLSLVSTSVLTRAKTPQRGSVFLATLKTRQSVQDFLLLSVSPETVESTCFRRISRCHWLRGPSWAGRCMHPFACQSQVPDSVTGKEVRGDISAESLCSIDLRSARTTALRSTCIKTTKNLSVPLLLKLGGFMASRRCRIWAIGSSPEPFLKLCAAAAQCHSSAECREEQVKVTVFDWRFTT
eukprot:4378-Rhodomonas_salina.1